MIKKLICIACPRGCRLSVSFDKHEQPIVPENVGVSGNLCPKGLAYGRQEVIRPMRTLTTTVTYTLGTSENGANPKTPIQERVRLPVKTACEIPLKDMISILHEIRDIHISKSVRCGDIITVLHGTDGGEIPVIACASAEEL